MDLPSFTSEIENVILMDEIPIIPIAEGYTKVRPPTRRHPWKQVRIKWLNQDGYVEKFFNYFLIFSFPKFLEISIIIFAFHFEIWNLKIIQKWI